MVNDERVAAPILSYSFGVKGLYAGVSLDGGVLVARNKCNLAFYGKNIDLKQVQTGDVETPVLNGDYTRIIQLLNINGSVTEGEDVDVCAANLEDMSFQSVGKVYAPALNQNEGINHRKIEYNHEYDQFNSNK